MNNPFPRQQMPPGLKSQIAFAVLLTVLALIVLPSALSAGAQIAATRATGTVVTTQAAFHAGNFEARHFSDWD